MQNIEKQQTLFSDKHCAVCRPESPWKKRRDTCCAEHGRIFDIALAIRKGTATGQWEPDGPESAKERWRNRATRIGEESSYKRHWLYCIVAQGGKCGDPQKDPTRKGCGRRLLALPAAAVHVDHIVPRKNGGSHDWENCQALCVDCNIRAGDGSNEDSSIQVVQREWEVGRSDEIVRQAREQEGRCSQCRKWIWSRDSEKIHWWTAGKKKVLVCNGCGEDIRNELENKKKEQERKDRETRKQAIERHRRRKKLKIECFFAAIVWVSSYFVMTLSLFAIPSLSAWASFSVVAISSLFLMGRFLAARHVLGELMGLSVCAGILFSIFLLPFVMYLVDDADLASPALIFGVAFLIWSSTKLYSGFSTEMRGR